jgi:hypothetical protein
MMVAGRVPLYLREMPSAGFKYCCCKTRTRLKDTGYNFITVKDTATINSDP